MSSKGMFSICFILCVLLLDLQLVHAMLMYVGTEATSLYLCDFDEVSGSVSLIHTFAAQYPSFLALHPTKQYLYTVNEVEIWDRVNNSGGISAYKVDGLTGELALINSVPSHGADPAHISLDSTGRWIGVANYGSGNYGVWKVEDDFSIAKKYTSFKQDQGKGPQPNQDGPHAHEFVFDRSNSFVVVPDLGNDMWNQYFFEERSGDLTSAGVVNAPSGSGPRHFIYHPFLPFAYGVSEITSMLFVFSAPIPLKALSLVQNVSTLPSPPQPSAAAELQFSPDGQYLYASNRYTNGMNGTIAVFSIDPTTGFATTVGYFGTQGVYPRFFTLSFDGRFVLVANQLSSNIRVFERDSQTGKIGTLVGSLDGVTNSSHILLL